MDPTFDPFNDRKARDIRNSLSAALVADLVSGKDSCVDRVAGTWMPGGPFPAAAAIAISARIKSPS